MANILVHIELEDGDATAASLATVNLGRRVASQLGAALYALLPCSAPPTTYDDEDIIAVLSRHGADKVALVTNPKLSFPMDVAQIARVLANACRRFPPRLVLLSRADHAPEVAKLLASALGARSLQPADRDEAELEHQWLADKLGTITLPVVVAAEAAEPAQLLGEADTEVVVFQTSLEQAATGLAEADTEH